MKIDPLDFPPDVRRLEVVSIEDDGNVTLCVVAAEVRRGPVEKTVVGMAAPLVWDETSYFWRFTWHRYVSVLLLNESWTSGDPSEPAPERMLQRSDDLPFLPFSKQVTWARDDYPGPLALWELGSLNHIIQVVSTDPPEVERLTAAELEATS